MTARPNAPPKRRPRLREKRGTLSSPRATIVELLDDQIDELTVHDWHGRNLRLVDLLVSYGLYDQTLVPKAAHRSLTDALIHRLNSAATDPQNAGHVRAQNENVIHYGLAAEVPVASLTIALEAGFIHDLNKALGEPLRLDQYAVRDARGRVVAQMTSMAQIVGLNHLGERTRIALFEATRAATLAPEVAEAIDRTIVHHGLGSSRFIQELIDGKNPWWGKEFVEDGQRKLIHPPQPPLTLESVVHDLADSTQQMQGGAAWLMKYPAGFWRASGRTLAEMLSGSEEEEEEGDGGVPMSLRRQIEVESATCAAIVQAGLAAGILSATLAQRLREAVVEASVSSTQWIEDSSWYLEVEDGQSVYHDVGRALGIAPAEARRSLAEARTGTAECDALIPVVWESGRRVDLDRARALAQRIESGRPR